MIRYCLMKLLGLTTALLTLVPCLYAATGAPSSNPITAEVTGHADNRVGETAYFVVAIRNTTAAAIKIKSVEIAIDGPARDRFLEPDACKLQQMGEPQLAPGAAIEQSCNLAMKPARVLSLGAGHQSSLLAANVRVSITTSIDRYGIVQVFPSFTIKAPEFSIFIGGWVGALMLALFVWVERILKSPNARQEWGNSLFVTILLGARGGVMAVIALMLSKTTESSGSPVSLTVADFTGGVLVGLFSYPLATWISSTLKLDGVFVPRSPPASPAQVIPSKAVPAPAGTAASYANLHEDSCDAAITEVTRDEDLPPATGGVAS